MNSENQGKSDGPSKLGSSKPVQQSSGLLRRLVIIALTFGVIAGGIVGYKAYLKAIMPKEDPNFIKKRSEDSPSDEPLSNMQVLSELFSPAQPSKEVVELKSKTADEVAFTYEAIMAMNAQELKTNIENLSARLTEVRNDLPPSVGGASMGGGGSPKKKSDNDDAKGETKETASVPFLALPLEVMLQVSKEID